ncbi:uncharacterized protein F5147DRAFT_665492 [Suillus discolor]|uniref:Uncharacterized protein n=1 Tax=Suillus discolor TaxID=1912936 RepID=A0A9P7FIX6_9AGAM|nr:uncharacterized protein F5147DRAFT_665492 [Suillus discolor]KAG2119819.1 hypothetical protein F5147DRAFT_665492 [Suillus discolor]
MARCKSMLRAEAAAFVPRMQRPKDGVEIHPAEKENLNLVPQEADREEVMEKEVSVIVDSEATDDMEDMDEAVTSLTSLDLVPDESLRSNGPSEEQALAARTIQYAYRYHVWRRSGSAVDAQLHAISTTCLMEMQSSKWRPSYYRIVLTHAAKIKTKDPFNTESHEKLEELGRPRSEITSVAPKKGMQLRGKLEPSSPDHHTRDIDALKCAKIPGSTMDMQTKFQMAYKGIVAEKKLFHVRNERPVLNVEDLDPIV